MNGIKSTKSTYTKNLLPYYYSVLNDKISFSVLLWFNVTKKTAYESEIRFDPSIPDLGGLAIPHAIISVNKLYELFIPFIFTYFVVHP
jgi:hypothetical protein